MNALFRLSALTFVGCLTGLAQNIYEELTPDHVLEAIEEFNRKDSGRKPNEVVVVLDSAKNGDAPPDETADAPRAKPVEEEDGEVPSPVLVTGKPPAEETPGKSAPAAEGSEETAAEETAGAVDGETPPADPEGGLDVRVEKLRTREGSVNPGEVKLAAPFPAKPLSQPPAGWMIDTSEEVAPLTREVELSPGSRITLTIRPHLLVPEADGYEVFAIPEPGFDPSLGYEQAGTVGGILSESVRELDDHSRNLGQAIDRLQQLLVSLPKPEAEEPASPPAKK